VTRLEVALLVAIIAAVFLLVVKCGPPDEADPGDPCPTCGGTLLPHGHHPLDTVVCSVCTHEMARARK
jgi:hypothetical protein